MQHQVSVSRSAQGYDAECTCGWSLRLDRQQLHASRVLGEEIGEHLDDGRA